MTQEHITITEEVVKDGQVVTEERVTVQTTPDPHDNPVTNAAMGVSHPDFVPAAERTYTYNEATGMSESEPAEVVVDVSPEQLEELQSIGAVEPETDADEELGFEPETDSLCLHIVGNGFCQLPADHEGQHKLNVGLMIANTVEVFFLADGRCVVTAFTGDDRLERALNYAQGLQDENKAWYLREHQYEDLDVT